MSSCLRPHELQHTSLPCPSLSPKVCSNSCPWSRWCHPTISSSVIPLFSCLQSFPTSESFLMSWLFKSGGQSIGASTPASVLPVNIQDWFFFRVDWFNLQVMSNSLWPHGLQHTRLFCPPLSPGVCSDSCPLSCWCYLTISSSASPAPFAFSFPRIRFQWVRSLHQSKYWVSVSTSVLPMNIQDWFPLGLTNLIIFQSKRLSRIFTSTTVKNH